MRVGSVSRSAFVSERVTTCAKAFVLPYAAACLSAALSACSVPEASPPPAEFLVATPDSTFWVQSGNGGVHIRGVPMTLARYGGRFHEIYVTGIDRSYTDAIFTGERLYQRDLVRGDSAVVLDDSAVVASANRYARATPNAQPLDPDDPDPEDPTVSITGETDILGVRGPYVWVEHRLSVQSEDDERYDTTQTAIDLRTSRSIDVRHAFQQTKSTDSVTAVPLPKTWHRHGFDLIAQEDTASGSVVLTLRDAVRRTWPILSVGSTPRIYWIDTPAIDTTTRAALRKAFNAAAQYDETVRLASWHGSDGCVTSACAIPVRTSHHAAIRSHHAVMRSL